MINKASTIFFIFWITFAGFTARAQETTINLDEAIDIALQSNKQIKISELEVKKARAAVSEAFGYALPSVDVSAGLTRFLEKPRVPFPDFQSLLGNSVYSILFNEGVLPFDPAKFRPLETKLQSFAQTNNYEASITLTQIIFNSAVFRGIGASAIYLNLAKERLKATVSETVLNVKNSFYGVLLLKEMLKITQERLQNAEENLRNLKSMNEKGLVSDFDVLQVEVQVENIKPKLIELQNALLKAKDGLKITLGISQHDKIDVTGKFDYNFVNYESDSLLISEAMENNYNLKVLRLKKQVDDEFVEIDRSDYWPTIALFGNYKFAGSSDSWDFQNYTSSMIGINFSINLFKGRRVVNKVEQSEIAAFQTLEQIALTEDFLRLQIKEKLNELKQIQSQIEALDRNVSLAEKAYDIAKVKYREGSATQLEVKNADVELSLAKTNRIKAVHDYVLAQAQLENLLGKVDKKYFADFKDYLE